MVHANTRPGLHDAYAHRLPWLQINRVVPASAGHAAFASAHNPLQHRKLSTMNVEGMIHIGIIDDFPVLPGADPAVQIDTLHIKRLAVKQEGRRLRLHHRSITVLCHHVLWHRLTHDHAITGRCLRQSREFA